MRWIVFFLLFSVLPGCASINNELDRPMEFRRKLIESGQCTFGTQITAHYNDKIYQFQMECSTDTSGSLMFTITNPESIRGISGKVSNSEAAFTFDNQIVAFPVLADGRLSPVCGPWIFYHTLRSGYLTGCIENDQGYQLSIDDSYADNPLHLQIQTDEQCVPIYAEIYYQQNMVLSLDVENFTVV